MVNNVLSLAASETLSIKYLKLKTAVLKIAQMKSISLGVCKRNWKIKFFVEKSVRIRD